MLCRWIPGPRAEPVIGPAFGRARWRVSRNGRVLIQPVGGDQPDARVAEGVPTQLRYGQERCVQAFKAVSAGFASGPASTGALGADSTVTAAAMVAATMTAVVF